MAGMSTGTQDVESELIESVCERVRERVAPEEVEEAEAFVRAYYRRAPAEDLRGREPVDLYGAALAHWTFGRERDAGRAARCASTTRRSSSTAGSRRTPRSTSSATTCRSSWTR